MVLAQQRHKYFQGRGRCAIVVSTPFSSRLGKFVFIIRMWTMTYKAFSSEWKRNKIRHIRAGEKSFPLVTTAFYRFIRNFSWISSSYLEICKKGCFIISFTVLSVIRAILSSGQDEILRFRWYFAERFEFTKNMKAEHWPRPVASLETLAACKEATCRHCCTEKTLFE